MTMKETQICASCTAGNGLFADRCESCSDFSGFQMACGYAAECFAGLSAAGRLALVLIEMAALENRIGDLEGGER